MNKTVQELIDEALAPKEKRARSGKFSPSSFGKCFRNQIWNRKDVPPTNPPDARAMRIFKAGDLFHSFVQDIIGGEKEKLVEIDDVKGYADIVNTEEVVDIKSQHSKKFWYIQKELDAGRGVRDLFYNNWLQVGWYAKQLNKPGMRLVFISKDDLCVQEFLQETKDWETNINFELDTLRTFWASDILPPAKPRLYEKKDGTYGECAYCSFRTMCEQKEKK